MNTINPNRTRGKFKKGTSGNPNGRPLGTRNRATLLAEQLLEGEAEQLISQVITLAKKGNLPALRLCLERLIPARKERSIEIELKPAQNVGDIAGNYRSILAAISEGRITPGEAHALVEILSNQARLFESVDLELRIQKLAEFKTEAQAYKWKQEQEMQRFTDENKGSLREVLADADEKAG